MLKKLNLFRVDLETIFSKMKDDLDEEELKKMLILKNNLLELNNKNLVKINHSVMELVCAKHLIKAGFNVELEFTLKKISCDMYAVKGYGSVIVEVETGFVPPEHAVDPMMYLRARIISKITRYSSFANKFILATPPYYIMQIPPPLTKPPRFRTDDEINSIKCLCDLYYSNPPVTIEEIRNARLHSIYAIDVDNATVTEWDVNEYLGKASLWRI